MISEVEMDHNEIGENESQANFEDSSFSGLI